MSKEVLDLTQRMMLIESTRRNPDALYEVMELARQELSDFPRQDYAGTGSDAVSTPSSIFSSHQGAEGFRVLLHGHLDVVPAQDRSQFTPRIEGSKLIGRGSCDMKAGAAAVISLFRELANELPYSIGLSLTTDEETAGMGAITQAANGPEPSFVISAEPTNLAVGNQHKGLLTVELGAETKGGHTAYDGEENNALLQVMRTQMKVLETYPSPSKQWETSCAPTFAEVPGYAGNVVPAQAIGRLSVRYIPQDDPEVIKQFINDINSKVSVIQISSGMPAHYTSPDHRDVQRLLQVTDVVTGSPGSLVALPHSSDIVQWTRRGIDAVDFGPIGEGLHTRHEYVDIPSLDAYRAIMKHFLLSIAEE